MHIPAAMAEPARTVEREAMWTQAWQQSRLSTAQLLTGSPALSPGDHYVEHGIGGHSNAKRADTDAALDQRRLHHCVVP